MSSGIFNFGSYFGVPHVEVCNTDPHYIVYCYENLMDNGGISREIYRQAIMIIHDGEMDVDFDEEAAIIQQELEDIENEDWERNTGC